MREKTKSNQRVSKWVTTREVRDWDGHVHALEGYWYLGDWALAHPSFTTDIDIYRWRDDDGSDETDATWLEVASTTHDFDVDSGDVEARLRVNISEFGGADDNNAAVYQLYFQINSGGYALVTNATTGVQYFNSTKLTDDGNTTEQLNGGGTFEGTNGVCEDGQAASYILLSNNDHEIEYTVKFIAADLSNSDSIDFQIVSDTDGIVTETVTPNATITKSAAGFNAYWAINSNGIIQ